MVKGQMASRHECSSLTCLHREINDVVQKDVAGQEKVDLVALAAEGPISIHALREGTGGDTCPSPASRFRSKPRVQRHPQLPRESARDVRANRSCGFGGAL
jgi:hypothetical protein